MFSYLGTARRRPNSQRILAFFPILRDRISRRLDHDPYQRKTIPKKSRFSVVLGEFNEMNASSRREDLLTCLDYALSGPTAASAGRTGRCSSTLGWMLFTGLACSGPLTTHAAEWLSSSSPAAAVAATTAATTTATAAPSAPTPPLPPSPPAAPASVPAAAKPPVQDQAKSKDKSQDKSVAKTVTSTVTATWQSLTSWMNPPASASKTQPQAKIIGGSAAPANTIVASPASPLRSPGTSRPTTSVGRFDPEFGPAGYSVSDAADQTAQAEDMPRLAPPRQFMPPQSTPEKEQSAVASDDPVSLVSWLSSYYSGDHGGSGDACPDVCLTDTCCPTWEAQVDALFLWQGNIPSRPLYSNTATGATALDANQLYAPAAIAPRYALTYHRDDCRAIEVNYFQVWGFNAAQMIGPLVDGTGNGGYTMGNIVGQNFSGIGGARATSSAQIQSLEVNLRRTDGGMIEWISGFRWLEWGQGLNIADASVANFGIVGGDIASINTLNNLYGWQWGGDMMLWNAGRWLRVNGIAKAGVYYNHQASQNTFYTDFTNPDVNVASANDTVSFVGETGINASLALTNWLSWRAGYTCFWLGGVATPARQLGLTNIDTSTTSINTNGSVFLHGVNTGLEARW